MKNKNQSVYDGIFDFLFSVQTSKKSPNVRSDRKYGDFGNALLEIGSQPAIYPVGIVMDEMNSLIEEGTAVQMGNVPKLATSFYSRPKQIHQNVQRERRKRNDNRLLALWTSIGGNLDANGDGALLAMLATKFDI